MAIEIDSALVVELARARTDLRLVHVPVYRCASENSVADAQCRYHADGQTDHLSVIEFYVHVASKLHLPKTNYAQKQLRAPDLSADFISSIRQAYDTDALALSAEMIQTFACVVALPSSG